MNEVSLRTGLLISGGAKSPKFAVSCRAYAAAWGVRVSNMYTLIKKEKLMIIYSDVVKRYGPLTAVDHLNLEIQKGEIFGLLGPNGSGKTTVMRMTTTLTPPTSGRILVDGEPIHRNAVAVKQRLGIVPQANNLENDLNAWQNLEYHGMLYGMEKKYRRRRIQELLEFVGLTERQKDIARFYSGGMKRKMMLAKALMHEPEIILLDEPTVGLDAAVRRKMWDLLKQLKDQGLTIFLTTHYLEEAQTLCSRVGLIDKGKLVKTSTPEQMIRELGSFVLEYYRNGETRQEFYSDREAALRAGNALAVAYQVREANLEDVFIRLTNKGLGAAEAEG